MYRFGIDIGGTKIAAIMIEATSEKVCFEKTIATPDHYEGLCKAIVAMVKEIDSAFYPYTIGIAHPGSCCPKTGKMRNSNRLWLNDKSFIADLEQALGQSIRSSNDGNCFVLSEAMNGAAKDHKVVFGATLGTGLGGGLVVDKKLNHGRNLIGAEWGHIAMPWVEAHELPGPACYCGLHNCLESHLSGTG